jgi:hypothetical protein
MILVALQPVYLPWLGYFDQMQRSDVFVFYDDGQFDRRGWRNRNRIKSPAGLPVWLTVPIRHNGVQRIMDVEVDNSQAWARRHVNLIRNSYVKSAFLKRYLPELEDLLNRRWQLIVDLDLALIDLICRWLGLRCRTVRNSTIGLRGKRSELALELCLHYRADRYLSGNAAQVYFDVPLLERHGITVEWQNYRHPVYRQLHGDFLSHMSVLDLILNCGEGSLEILSSQSMATGAEARMQRHA